jgi:hypothetical protein
VFNIEDSIHCEHHVGYPTLADAVAELQRLALVPWNESPNLAPCTGWRKCGREWQIVEYDDSTIPWKRLSQETYLEVDANGVRWHRVPNPEED